MKKVLVSFGLVIMVVVFGVIGVMTPSAWADEANVCDDSNISQELKDAAGCMGNNNEKTVMPLAEALINTVLTGVGILAVGVIVYGGITYSTSLGDPGKTTKAKNIILYGVVGLIVALLSWAIVNFVSKSISS